MNTFKNSLKINFSMIPNELINSPKISWKAKGIFNYLASKPDDWEFLISEIMTHATDGKESLQSGLKELEDRGYLRRERSTDKSGKFNGWDWILEMPKETDEGVSRSSGKPNEGKTEGRESPSYNKTDITNTETKKEIEKDKPVQNKFERYTHEDGSISEVGFICQYFVDSLTEYDPTHRYKRSDPIQKTWIEEADRMLRIDGRTKEQVKFMIDFLWNFQESENNRIASFWRPNVQSIPTLRKKFDHIKAQIIESRKSHDRSNPSKQAERAISNLNFGK